MAAKARRAAAAKRPAKKSPSGTKPRATAGATRAVNRAMTAEVTATDVLHGSSSALIRDAFSKRLREGN